METAHVLVVDDDPQALEILAELLRRDGRQVTTAPSGTAAVRAVREAMFDVVLTDLRLPDLDGLEVLRAVHTASPDTAVIVLTAFGTMDTAIAAIQAGAYDYLSKPFKLPAVRLIVQRALERKCLLHENRQYRQELQGQYQLANVIGASETHECATSVEPTAGTFPSRRDAGTFVRNASLLPKSCT